MSFAVILLGLALVPQLEVQPRRAELGSEFVVTTRVAGKPKAGVVVEVLLPDASTASCGVTGADGRLRHRATQAGYLEFRAELDGVRYFAAVAVQPAARGWLLAFGTVPLALALAWRGVVGRRQHSGGR